MHKSGQAGPFAPFLEPGNETLFATNFVKYLVALFLLLSLIYRFTSMHSLTTDFWLFWWWDHTYKILRSAKSWETG